MTHIVYSVLFVCFIFFVNFPNGDIQQEIGFYSTLYIYIYIYLVKKARYIFKVV